MDGGTKHDGGKLRYDLIPVGPLAEVARVYTMGAAKYDDRNWEKGLSWGRVYAALQRHANAWWGGERNDPVDGQHHLSSVVWCALALMEYERTHPELDDRSVHAAGYIIEFKGMGMSGPWGRSITWPEVYKKDEAELLIARKPDHMVYRMRPVDDTGQVIQ